MTEQSTSGAARGSRWVVALALVTTLCPAGWAQPSPALSPDDLKVWNQMLPRCARYYAEVGGELYANLKYDRAAQASGAVGKAAGDNKREVKFRIGEELLSLKSRPLGTSVTPGSSSKPTGVVKRQPVDFSYIFDLPPEESALRRTALPRFALHEFGRIHSARIEAVTGPEEMVLTDIALFDQPAYAAAKAKETADLQGWATNERGKLAVFGRKRNIDRKFFENDDTASLLRTPSTDELVKMKTEAVEWQFATRTQLDAEQKRLAGAHLHVRGVSTTGLRVGDRWSGAKDVLALAAHQGNDWTAVPAKSFSGNVDPKRYAAYLESRKITQAGFVALVKKALQSQEPRPPEARVVAAIELPPPPPLLDGAYTATLSNGSTFVGRVTGDQLVFEQQTGPATGQPATPPSAANARPLTISRRDDGSCAWTHPDGTFEVWTPTETGDVQVARWKKGESRQRPPSITGTAKRKAA